MTTVLCKSTGASRLLIFGVAVLWVTKRTKRSWLIWLLLAIPALLHHPRRFNLWSGQEVVQTLRGDRRAPDRAQSFDFRRSNDGESASRSVPWSNRSSAGEGSIGTRFTKEDGKVRDGLGRLLDHHVRLTGLVGLTSLVVMMLLPMVLTIRRFPVATWSDPRVGPAVGLALMLTLMMIDFLSNAMLNPIYALTMGGSGRPVGGPTGKPSARGGSEPRRAST